MAKYFKCSKCNHDLFEDRGLFVIAQVKFQGLKCLNCGNKIFLETNNKKYKQISSQYRIINKELLSKK